jgi:hypothetical protein
MKCLVIDAHRETHTSDCSYWCSQQWNSPPCTNPYIHTHDTHQIAHTGVWNQFPAMKSTVMQTPIHTYTHTWHTSDCSYWCLKFPAMKCAAIEFEPDDTSKVMVDQGDRGLCHIQRRKDGTVRVANRPGRWDIHNIHDIDVARIHAGMAGVCDSVALPNQYASRTTIISIMGESLWLALWVKVYD